MAQNLNANDDLRYSPQSASNCIAAMSILDTGYPWRHLLEKVVDKWTVSLVYALIQGPKQYSELKQQIVDISPDRLVQSLRYLERAGLVARNIYPMVPPKVDYALTPLGKSLAEPLAVLGEWAYRHLSDVDAAIAQYGHNATKSELSGPRSDLVELQVQDQRSRQVKPP